VHSRAVYVLLVDTADVPDDLSVTRRVFMALGNPSADYVSVSVRVFLEGRFQEDVA
jgi:hypothetical protein